jgi:hypothetical protein
MGFDDLVGRWPKTCSGCTRRWDAPTWAELPLVSASVLGVGAYVEVRRCRCGELLGAAVERKGGA